MLKNSYRSYLPLFFILVIASALRFGWLSKYPVSLNVDEVAIGYDAFSILNTGKDVHQHSFPLVFESLGDYKPGFYIYSVVLSEAIFGLNEFAVRFPSALAGVVTIFVLYLLVKLTTDKRSLALFSAMVLTFSPWHLKLSRGAFEANMALCLLLLGFYLTLVAIKKSKKMNWGLLFFALSMYTYHSEKVIAPLLLVSLCVVFWNELVNKKLLISWIIIFAISITPFMLTLGNNNQSRLASKLVTKDQEISIFVSRSTELNNFDRLAVSINTVFRRYIQFLDFGYTTNKGLDFTNSTSFDMGWIYWLEFPLLMMGIFVLAKNKIFVDKKYLYCFGAWTLLSPLPASITMDDYHIYRLITLVIPFSVLIAIGINKLVELQPKYIYIGLVIMYLINISIFADYYLLHYSYDKSDWQFDPSKEVAVTVLENLTKYDKIIVDPVFGKDGPYIYGVPDLYILFYGKIKPQEYWSSITDKGFKNIEFRRMNWNIEKLTQNNLLIGSVWSLAESDLGPAITKKIKYFNGETAYLVAETPAP